MLQIYSILFRIQKVL